MERLLYWIRKSLNIIGSIVVSFVLHADTMKFVKRMMSSGRRLLVRVEEVIEALCRIQFVRFC